MHIHIHRCRSIDEDYQETYKGYLIQQTSSGFEVLENGKHVLTYRTLKSAKEGIDRVVKSIANATRQAEMKRKSVGGRSAA